jgi:hypothetical protein
LFQPCARYRKCMLLIVNLEDQNSEIKAQSRFASTKSCKLNILTHYGVRACNNRVRCKIKFVTRREPSNWDLAYPTDRHSHRDVAKNLRILKQFFSEFRRHLLCSAGLRLILAFILFNGLLKLSSYSFRKEVREVFDLGIPDVKMGPPARSRSKSNLSKAISAGSVSLCRYKVALT